MQTKTEQLKQYFATHPKLAIAYSGGIDSTLLIHMAKKYGTQCKAYYIETIFQQKEETERAIQTAIEIEIPLTTIKIDIQNKTEITQNNAQRCYHCKKTIFTNILNQARKDGYAQLIDGTNASDDPQARPGTKALSELSVLSPFAQLNITKQQIRKIAKEENLKNWDTPSNSCLATRIKTDTQITKEKLTKTEKAEKEIKALGYKEIRIKNDGTQCTIQPLEQTFFCSTAFSGELHKI